MDQKDLEEYAEITGKGVNTLLAINNNNLISLILKLNAGIMLLLIIIVFAILYLTTQNREPIIKTKEVVNTKIVYRCPANTLCVPKDDIIISKRVIRKGKVWTYGKVRLDDGYYYITSVK